MSAKPFEATVRRENDAVTIDVRGDINAFAEKDLTAAYTQAESGDPSVIMLNLTEVAYVNSTGIALIVGLLARARKSHKRLLVFGLSEHYLKIFQITRLADFMEIYEDEASALHDAGTNRANP